MACSHRRWPWHLATQVLYTLQTNRCRTAAVLPTFDGSRHVKTLYPFCSHQNSWGLWRLLKLHPLTKCIYSYWSIAIYSHVNITTLWSLPSLHPAGDPIDLNITQRAPRTIKGRGDVIAETCQNRCHCRTCNWRLLLFYGFYGPLKRKLPGFF